MAFTPAAPSAPELTFDQLMYSVVKTGDVIGTAKRPDCCAVPPSVAFAATAMVSGISLEEALPLVTVMPVGIPLISPTEGVTFFVPL